jgi:hypothetical protein
MTEWNWNGWWAVRDADVALRSQFAKGIGAASFLHAIMRQGDVIAIATQSMLVGRRWGITAIRVNDEAAVPPFMMPTGMVTMLYSLHHGGQMLAVDTSGAACYAQPFRMGNLGPADRVATVDVLATRSRHVLYVHMINRAFDRAQVVEIDCSALRPAVGRGTLHILEGRLQDQPGPGESPAPARLRREPLRWRSQPVRLTLAPRTVTFAEFPLQRDTPTAP